MRHAETLWNVERRYQGQTDVPLSDNGRKQAGLLKQRLQKHKELFDAKHAAIVSSDLSRAAETARIIFGDAIRLDEALRESRYGIFEGLCREEIKERFPEHYEKWMADAHDFVIPGGEPRQQVRARATKAVNAWLEKLAQPTLIVVTHGGVMRQLIQHIITSFDSAFDVGTKVSYHNAVVHVVTIEDGVWSYGGTL